VLHGVGLVSKIRESRKQRTHVGFQIRVCQRLFARYAFLGVEGLLSAVSTYTCSRRKRAHEGLGEEVDR
jgi:hypothetical protein